MSDATWWYEWNGRQAGPVTDTALLELIRSGLLRPSARVWRAGMTGWEELARVPVLAAAVPAAPPPPIPPAAAPPAVPGAAAPPDAAAGEPPAATAPSAGEPTATPAPPEAAATEPLPTAVGGGATAGATGAAAPEPGPARRTLPPPAEGGGWAPPPSAPAAAPAALPSGMEPTSTAAVIGLGLVTLGIYPMIRFYQAALAYEELAGRRSRFVVYFWLSIGLALAGGPLHLAGGIVGFAAHVGALACTILTLFEVLALRADACRRQAIGPVLTPDGTHKALFIVGLFTSWFLLGIVLLLVQAVKFFHDHRAIADALRARGAAPAGTAPGQPAPW